MKVVNAVLAIVRRDATVLITERSADKSFAGFWELPGGKIEQHETAWQALTRELQEEIGIKLIRATYLNSHTYAYPDRIVNLLLWQIDQFENEPSNCEGQAMRWVTFAELDAAHLLPGTRAFLADIEHSLAN